MPARGASGAVLPKALKGYCQQDKDLNKEQGSLSVLSCSKFLQRDLVDLAPIFCGNASTEGGRRLPMTTTEA